MADPFAVSTAASMRRVYTAAAPRGGATARMAGGRRGRTSTEVQHGLLRRTHDLQVLRTGLFGGARIVRNDADRLSASTELRKDGALVAY